MGRRKPRWAEVKGIEKKLVQLGFCVVFVL